MDAPDNRATSLAVNLSSPLTTNLLPSKEDSEVPPGAGDLRRRGSHDEIGQPVFHARRGRTFEEALGEIERAGGYQFDPAIVDVFLAVPVSAWRWAGLETAGLALLPTVH